MSQRVVFPLDSRIASRSNHGLEEAIFGVRPDMTSTARCYRQPAQEIVRDRHDATRGSLGLVRSHFDVSLTAFRVVPLKTQDFRRAQPGERTQGDARRNFLRSFAKYRGKLLWCEDFNRGSLFTAPLHALQEIDFFRQPSVPSREPGERA